MRIPEYQVYQRRSLPWIVRWGVRGVVWFLMGLIVLLGWWAKYVFDNAEPFEGLHTGKRWISLGQLSEEARGYVEVRWERGYGGLARIVWDRNPFDHSLHLGSRILYWRILTPNQAQELALNFRLNTQTEHSLPSPPSSRMDLEEILRCTWGARSYDCHEFDCLILRPMVREGHLSEFRRDEILFKLYEVTPPYLLWDRNQRDWMESILLHCRRLEDYVRRSGCP